MDDQNRIINFSFNINNFIASVVNLVDNRLIVQKKQLFLCLEKISDKENRVTITNEDCSHTYRTFLRLRDDPTNLFQYFQIKRRVKKLCFALDYQEGKRKLLLEKENLVIALSLIEKKFSTQIALILFEILLRNWLNNELDLLRHFIAGKLINYKTKNKVLLQLVNNNNFFLMRNGTIQLASTIISQNIQIPDVNKYFKLAERFIRYEYFKDLCIILSQNISRLRQPHIEDDFFSFLNKISDHVLSKKCIVTIVYSKKETTDEILKEKYKSTAMRLIGDPMDDYKWQSWEGITKDEKIKLQETKTLLNEWINREVIEYFFKKLVIDRDRKEFWLKYYKMANRIKIFINPSSKWKIKLDTEISYRIGELLHSSGDQCSLLMEFNNYVLVEFSVKGSAFYAYRKNNPLCPDINKKSLSKNSLINPYKMEMLLKRQNGMALDMIAEGRFSHFQGWENYLDRWIRKFLRI